jgi:DNA-binding transcriptional MerR regulator
MSETYKIGEAAALLNLKTYVLRFWETEFPDIVPLRTEKGQRLYTTEHLALLERIRYLLHDRGLTIGGARKALAEEKALGLRYLFGIPGALPRGLTAAGLYTEPEPEYEDDGFDEEPVPTRRVPRSGKSVPIQTGQFNLPGLEELIALRERVLDSPTWGEYGSSEDGPGDGAEDESGDAGSLLWRDDDAERQRERPLDTPPGLLPLFSAVVAAFADAAGANFASGGSNFIQAGRESASPAALDPGEAERRVKLAQNETRAMLRVIARELEGVAALLRRDGASEVTPVPIAR